MALVQLQINGIDKTQDVLLRSLRVTDQINNKTDNMTFTIDKRDASVEVPPLGAEVAVFLDGVKVFGGVIVVIDQDIKGHNRAEYKVSCKDFVHFLDRKLVTDRITNSTVDAVILQLRDTYATDFTLNGVTAPTVVNSVAFNRITMSQCLNKLAKSSNYSWYVDYDKDIHFFPKNEELAPYEITDTSDNFIFSSLKIKKDISQLRNRVLVYGGDQEGDPVTEVFAGDTEKEEFSLAYKFTSAPTVTVDGVAQTVGIDYLDDDGAFQCMWNFNEKYIRFTAGNIPPAPTLPDINNIQVTGVPLFPIVVNVPSNSSINEFGEYEHAIKDPTLKSREQAIDRALAELDAYQDEINEGTFQTYTAGLRSGQTISVANTLHDINESFIIQKVQLTMLTPDQPIFTVTLATLKTIGIIDILQKLLEDEEITEGEQEDLLTFLQFEDSFIVTDSISPFEILDTTGNNFRWADAVNPDREFLWNKGNWKA